MLLDKKWLKGGNDEAYVAPFKWNFIADGWHFWRKALEVGKKHDCDRVGEQSS